ncbi:MAG: NAD-dependent epimerase/dehydratase family protein [Clostridiales bacterium]|nr:NAD-dependent epimerase/dehydratase family protein [Clostridiales bacterium]
MKILIVGGTGIIGSSVAKAAADHGNEVWILSRKGPHNRLDQPNVNYIQGDWYDNRSAREALSGGYDVVIDTLVFNVRHIRRSAGLSNGHCRQYIYISTDSVYPHPGANISEDDVTLPGKVKWKYGRDKLKCEQYLKEHSSEYSFYWTIVRPTITFGDTRIPVGFASRRNTFNLVERIANRKPVIRFDDASSRHAVCHVSLFGNAFLHLLLNEQTSGQCYNIADVRACTYDEIFRSIEAAVGTKGIYIHLPSETMKKYNPVIYEDLIYDKNTEFTLNSDKIRSICPGTSFETDIGEAITSTVRNLKSVRTLVPQDDDYDLLTDLILLKNLNRISTEKEKHEASEYISGFTKDYTGTLSQYERKCIMNNKVLLIKRALWPVKQFFKGVMMR